MQQTLPGARLPLSTHCVDPCLLIVPHCIITRPYRNFNLSRTHPSSLCQTSLGCNSIYGSPYLPLFLLHQLERILTWGRELCVHHDIQLWVLRSESYTWLSSYCHCPDRTTQLVLVPAFSEHPSSSKLSKDLQYLHYRGELRVARAERAVWSKWGQNNLGRLSWSSYYSMFQWFPVVLRGWRCFML